ncbi:unnamed protein product [Amoebophrya sp. A120]|nr:unnamed protein product [Amoebophrya sp. A120]|eukprot:GSA120T00023436001.1
MCICQPHARAPVALGGPSGGAPALPWLAGRPNAARMCLPFVPVQGRSRMIYLLLAFAIAFVPFFISGKQYCCRVQVLVLRRGAARAVSCTEKLVKLFCDV